MTNAIQVIFPYQDNGVWMFDDDAKGLVREPFVCGIPKMVVLLVSGIQHPNKGFALYFSDQQFPGFQVKVDLLEPEAGGNWYTLAGGGTEMKGWLCPALFKYFETAPTTIYAKPEAVEH
ncbi:MAG: hypothetical protein JWP63_1903 [Candidatus Solibacter sp.]|jgi:hypothetical protein|nr:hypothetical protein [Candidatus Solibacter sp.]